jgi:hypothetical protein
MRHLGKGYAQENVTFGVWSHLISCTAAIYTSRLGSRTPVIDKELTASALGITERIGNQLPIDQIGYNGHINL